MSKISRKLQGKIRRQAKNRCGYCLLPQNLNPTFLEIEHLQPVAGGGTETEENLWLACRECNSHKSAKIYGFDEKTGRRIRLYNPRRQNWNRHFKFSDDKTKIIGKTVCGRATVETLKLNSEILVCVRRLWVEFDLFPPKD
ncbi:MAG: HNH endonuclease [Pyrinomonadaceae bacterium]|nr:HNH endonuclease [Pyrinomonadaceae bacterium]